MEKQGRRRLLHLIEEGATVSNTSASDEKYCRDTLGTPFWGGGWICSPTPQQAFDVIAAEQASPEARAEWLAIRSSLNRINREKGFVSALDLTDDLCNHQRANVLLSGPPGTGKSYLGHAIEAAHRDFKSFSRSGATTFDPYVMEADRFGVRTEVGSDRLHWVWPLPLVVNARVIVGMADNMFHLMERRSLPVAGVIMLIPTVSNMLSVLARRTESPERRKWISHVPSVAEATDRLAELESRCCEIQSYDVLTLRYEYGDGW